MSDEDLNKSEQATPFKLTRAREKGAVARGFDLGLLAGLAAAFGALSLMGAALGRALALSGERAFAAAGVIAPTAHATWAFAGSVFYPATQIVVWLAGAAFLTVLTLEFIQTGPVFTFEPLKPDFSRLNPSNGFKRVFSLRLVIETGKTLLKLVVYVAIAFFVTQAALANWTPAIRSGEGLAAALRSEGMRLLAFFTLAALAFAILDQLIVRRLFQRRMRMSRRELRREQRDREGDPRIRQRRRQLHRQLTRVAQSLRNVRGADVLITNPTHYAVALKYDPKRMTAPIVVSQLANQLAIRLRKLAFVYGVTIIESPRLARALFLRGEINKPIPESVYREVAEIYIALNKRKASKGAA
jgi:flagellar biosynthesis protein FlhB